MFLQVELADPAQRIVKLGALRVIKKSTESNSNKSTEKDSDESIKKEVVVVNRSPIPLTFSVSLVTSSHQFQEDSSLLTVDTVDWKTKKPKSELTLKAKNGVGKVLVKFKPIIRISHFQEEVTCSYNISES